MTKIVQLHKAQSAGANKAQVQESALADNKSPVVDIQKMTKLVISLKKRLEFQANLNRELKSQVKEVQAENDILLGALEDDSVSVPLLTTPIEPGSMNGYWEQEYQLFREQIRVLEETLVSKDSELKAEKDQNELLLNELLTKR